MKQFTVKTYQYVPEFPTMVITDSEDFDNKEEARKYFENHSFPKGSVTKLFGDYGYEQIDKRYNK